MDIVRKMEATLKRQREEHNEVTISAHTSADTSKAKTLPSGRTRPPTPPAPKQRRGDGEHSA